MAEVPLQAMFVPSPFPEDVGCSGPASGVAVTPEVDGKVPRRDQLLRQPISSCRQDSPAWAPLQLPLVGDKPKQEPVSTSRGQPGFLSHWNCQSQQHQALEAEAVTPPLPGKACFLQVKNMRSAPSDNNKSHLLVTNITIFQPVCGPRGPGCGIQPLTLASSPCRAHPPLHHPHLPAMLPSRQGRPPRRQELSQSSNSWKNVKGSHKAVSHTPVTPVWQGHWLSPHLQLLQSPRLHTTFICKTTHGSRRAARTSQEAELGTALLDAFQ